MRSVTTSRPDVDASVVIPARNAARLLPIQLGALAAQQGGMHVEVVVADNGSTDDTAAVARAWADRFDRLRVVDASQQPGVSHARNVGASHATASAVLFCDADDEADTGWVVAMVEALGTADLVGGPLEPGRLSDPAVLRWRYVPPADALPVTMRFLPYATGANLGVKREVLGALGGFDTTYVGGHEEVDFAWRAQLAGHRLAFAPGALMHYRLRGDLRGTVRQTFGYGRSYAQLFDRFQHEAIPRTPLRREVRTYAAVLRQGVGALRRRELDAWLAGAAWTAGRLYGDVRYRVRAPL